MTDELDAEERRLHDAFRQVEAPASMRRWDAAADAAAAAGADAGAGRRWSRRLARPLLALFTTGGERRLRPLAAALVLPLLVLAVGGALQLGAHFGGGSSGSGNAPNPPAREAAAMAFDGAHGDVVLFGGSSSDGGGYHAFADTWTWDGSSWTQRHPAHSPSARSGAAMAYDAAHGVVVLFGGQARGPQGMTQNVDTWTWDGSDWRQVPTLHAPSPFPPAPAMAYDESSHQLVLALQTRGELAEPPGPQPRPIAVPPAAHLALPTPAGTAPAVPPPASGTVKVEPVPAPIFQPATAQVETWVWTGSDWQKRSPHTVPGGTVRGVSLAYDAAAHRLVLVTANLGGICSVTTLHTAPAPSPLPSPSAHLPVPAVGVAVGGSMQSCAAPLATSPSTEGRCNGCPDTQQWWWDGSDWHAAQHSPSARGPNAGWMVSDPAGRHLLVVEGGQTWIWDGSAWSMHQAPQALIFRTSPAIAADPAHGVVVLFGGRSGPAEAADTWTWDGKAWTHRAGPVPDWQNQPHPVAPMIRITGQPVPGPCGTPSIRVMPDPTGGVAIALSPIGNVGACPGGPVTVRLVDGNGQPLSVQGNGQQVSGTAPTALLWSNWCGTQGIVELRLQEGRADASETLVDRPACTDRSKPSTLAPASGHPGVTAP